MIIMLHAFPSPHGALFLSFLTAGTTPSLKKYVSVPAWGFVFVITIIRQLTHNSQLRFPSPHGALFLSLNMMRVYSKTEFGVGFRPRMGLCFCHCLTKYFF